MSGFNSDHLAKEFVDVPSWLCPHCQDGVLIADSTMNEADILSLVTHSEKTVLEDLGIDETDVQVPFCYVLRCHRKKCRQSVSIAGTAYIRENLEGQRDIIHSMEYSTPTIPLFKTKKISSFPSDGEPKIEETLQRCFRLFWVDPNSCMVAVRIFCELTLDTLDIPKKVRLPTKNGGHRSSTSFADRLTYAREEDGSVDPSLINDMDILRHPGNSGAHSSKEIDHMDAIAGINVVHDLCRELFRSCYEADRDAGARRRLTVNHK